jgi:HPt (histidine-containing phosphotransfer) domain-containing protein
MMIDREKWDETFRYFDNDVIVSIIDVYEKELPERLETIRKNIAESDFENLSFNAHSLKSVTGTFMAPSPADLCRNLEEMSINRNDLGMAAIFNELKSSSEELLRELVEIRRRLIAEDPSLKDTV